MHTYNGFLNKHKIEYKISIFCFHFNKLTLRTPANELSDRAGRRYSGGEKRH